MNQMVPTGAPTGAMVPGGQSANPFDVANASGAVAMLAPDTLAGGSFGEIWSIDGDHKCFINKKTQETRAELYIRVSSHPKTLAAYLGHVFFKDNEKVCWSDDAVSAYNGIACASCPRISRVEAFNKYYEKHPELQRPPYVGDGGRNVACNLRLKLKFLQDFVPVQGGLVCYDHEDPAMIDLSESAVYAFYGAKGLMPKLQQMRVDITTAVIKIVCAERENKAYHKMYSFGDFEFVDMAANVMAKVTKRVQITSATAASSQATATPASAPAAFPAPAGLPMMSGMAPAPAVTTAPAALAAAQALPPAAFPAPGPAAQPPQPAAALPASTSAFPAPVGIPGFPGMAAPAAAPQAPAQPAAAAPAPTFQEMAKNQLVNDYNSLPDNLKPLVLQMVQVARIEDVTFDRVLTASQAVTAARNYNQGQPAAAAAPGTALF